MGEPVGTYKCDVCGLDTPHGHSEFDVIQQRYARKSFQKLYPNATVRGPRLEDQYLTSEDSRRWGTYATAWLDAWKHFSEIQRCSQASGGSEHG